MHICHVLLWEFKEGNSGKLTAETRCIIYSEGLITEGRIKNCYVKFKCGDTYRNRNRLLRNLNEHVDRH